MGTRRPRRTLVTRIELAQHLGCNPRTVAKLIEEGLPVATRGRGGRASKYDLAECVAWKEARDQVAAEENIDLNAARARKEHWQAALAEQKHQMLAKQLLPAEEVAKAWSARITGAKNLLLASTTTRVDRVYRASVLDGLAGVEREWRGLVYEVLRELAGQGATIEVGPEPKTRRSRKKKTKTRTTKKRKKKQIRA